MEAFLVFTVDIEPDWVLLGKGGFRGVEEGLPRLLELVAELGIEPTFYVTGEIAEKYPGLVSRLGREGEVGSHGHTHSFLGIPFISLSTPKLPGMEKWAGEEVPDEASVFREIRVSTDAVGRAVGRRPVSFKAPWMSLHPHAYRLLEDLGYVASTTVPVWKYGGPILPYHPSSRKWLEEGDLRLVEVPLGVEPVPTVTEDLRVLYNEFSSISLRRVGVERMVRAARRIVEAQRQLGGPGVLVFGTIATEYADWGEGISVLPPSGEETTSLVRRLFKALAGEMGLEPLSMGGFARLWEEEWCPIHSRGT